MCSLLSAAVVVMALQTQLHTDHQRIYQAMTASLLPQPTAAAPGSLLLEQNHLNCSQQQQQHHHCCVRMLTSLMGPGCPSFSSLLMNCFLGSIAAASSRPRFWPTKLDW